VKIGWNVQFLVVLAFSNSFCVASSSCVFCSSYSKLERMIISICYLQTFPTCQHKFHTMYLAHSCLLYIVILKIHHQNRFHFLSMSNNLVELEVNVLENILAMILQQFGTFFFFFFFFFHFIFSSILHAILHNLSIEPFVLMMLCLCMWNNKKMIGKTDVKCFFKQLLLLLFISIIKVGYVIRVCCSKWQLLFLVVYFLSNTLIAYMWATYD